MQYKKGFTLIELLVVVAIIGLLASVVLASLNIARARAADTGIKSSLNAIRNQAAIIFDNNGNYGPAANDPGEVSDVGDLDNNCMTGGYIFWDDEVIKSALQGVFRYNGSNVAGACYVSGPPQPSFVLVVHLKSGTNPNYWCVDSAGNSIEVPYTAVYSFPTNGSAATCYNHS